MTMTIILPAILGLSVAFGTSALAGPTLPMPASPPAATTLEPSTEDPPLPPIAASRFAPDPSSLRELRMFGAPAPLPTSGEVIVGEPLDAWPTDQQTILVFWSPFVGGAESHLKRLQSVTAEQSHLEGISIALGPKDRVESVLANLGDPKNPNLVPPRTIVDEGQAWRQAFLEPLGLTSLPAVVVVDREGRITYHSALTAMLRPLAQMIADDWNPTAYRNDALEYAARMALMQEINRGRSLASRDRMSWDEVISLVREGISIDPRNTPLLVKEFDLLLADADRPDEAYEVGRRIIRDFPRSPITLNELAWHVVSLPGVSRRDLDFALDASRRANALQSWGDPGQLDTLARIHWLRGDESEAVRIQIKAVALAPDTWHGDGIRANLAAYTDGKVKPGVMPGPYRSPRIPR